MKVKQGLKVRVTDCSGLDSGKVGYIVSKRDYGHTVIDGYSRLLLNKSHWSLIAVTGHDLVATASEYIVMSNNRLERI